jgi:hypothetical protein
MANCLLPSGVGHKKLEVEVGVVMGVRVVKGVGWPRKALSIFMWMDESSNERGTDGVTE